MRFMMLMYPGPKAEAGVMPDDKLIAAMMAYNKELADAGVLLALDGLQPTAKGGSASPAARPASPRGRSRTPGRCSADTG
jgi:hypothetical protein